MHLEASDSVYENKTSVMPILVIKRSHELV